MNKPVHSIKPDEVGSFKAKTELSRLLRQTKAGKRFIITQRGTPVAELIPYQGKSSRASNWGDMKGQITIADDFMETPADFKDYCG